jgi:hypothetical protein
MPESDMSALKKTTLEEWGGVYEGVRAAPAPPHIPVLFSRLTFFQWSHDIEFKEKSPIVEVGLET